MAQWREEAGGKGGGGGLTFLATDHLGSPACALAGDGSVTWSGGFEPFGRDWQHGTPEGALASGLFLRLPGQWDHPYWHRDLRTEGFGADLFYNVHRWYEAGTGRYVSADPLGLRGSSALQVYGYAESNPLAWSDPFGLCSCKDDCPSGEWIYLGGNASFSGLGPLAGVRTQVRAAAAVTRATPTGGGYYSRGFYQCSEPGPTGRRSEVSVSATCGIVGLFAGAGGGIDFTFGFAPAACGCSRTDLLGRQTAWIGAAGYFGASTGKCGTGGGLFGRTFSAGPAVGRWGAGRLICEVRERKN